MLSVVAAVTAAAMPSFRASAVSAPAPNGQGTLVVIGDSLMEGTAVFGSLGTRLRRIGTWPLVTIDYRRGRTTVQGTKVLRQRIAAAKNPTALVIALGTNDMLSHSETSWPSTVINALMSETAGLPVLWVNITFSVIHPDWRVRAARFNRALRAAQAQWPGLRVADWSGSFVPAGRSNYIVDGIHLSTSGYRTRASWMETQIRRFGRDVVNASTTTTSSSTSTSSTLSTGTTTSTSTLPAPTTT